MLTEIQDLMVSWFSVQRACHVNKRAVGQIGPGVKTTSTLLKN